MASRPCCLFLFLDFHNWAPSVYEVLDLRGAIVSNSLLDVTYCFRCLENNTNGIVQPTGMVVHLTKMAVSQRGKTPTDGKNPRFCVKMTCKYKVDSPIQVHISPPASIFAYQARMVPIWQELESIGRSPGAQHPKLEGMNLGCQHFCCTFLWGFLTCWMSTS